MDARIEGQIRGIDHTIPRRDTKPAVAEARPQAVAPTKPASDRPAAVAAHELFDANSDGVIESWSYAHGGDSYETFNPPPSGQIGANGRRTGRTQSDAKNARSTDTGAARASTAAAMHKARGAYRRDGLANIPGARTAHASAASAAPTPTTKSTPQVTQPAPPVALPSARS